MNFKNILVTGGCGFIGSNFLNKYVQLFPQINFINVDCLTYAGDEKNILVSNFNNYKFYKADITNYSELERICVDNSIDGIIHFAAESSVDFSISNPSIFVETNVIGTHNLLLIARKIEILRFHHVSTDEVYGELGKEGFFTENTPIAPNSPYSASKASSDLLVRSYNETFKLNTVITRCSNNYGPNQDVSKLIPRFITNLLQDKKVGVYGQGLNVRDWLYVEDHCDGIWEVFTKAKSGSVYNIGGNTEKTNLEITKILLELLGKDSSYIEFIEDRKGHDFRYAIDATKIKTEIGWTPKHTFESAVVETINYYKNR